MDKADFHLKVQLQFEQEAKELGLVSDLPDFKLARLSQVAGKVAAEIREGEKTCSPA